MADQLDGSLHYTKFSISAGGVGRNICEALEKLGATPTMLSVVGNDNHGLYLRSLLTQSKTIELLSGHTTAQCTIMLDSNGDCKLLLGEMDIHKQITPELIRTQLELLKRSPLIVVDGNLPVETLDCVLEIAETHQKPVFYEPTDVPVAANPFHSSYSKNIKYITPNLNELKFIANYLGINVKSNHADIISEAAELGKLVAEYVDTIFVTLGAQGLMIIRKGSADDPLFDYNNKNSDIQVRHYSTTEITELVNVSGAGDCLASGIICSMLSGCAEKTCVSVGFAAAKMALLCKSAVPSVLFDKTHVSWRQSADYNQL